MNEPSQKLIESIVIADINNLIQDIENDINLNVDTKSLYTDLRRILAFIKNMNELKSHAEKFCNTDNIYYSINPESKTKNPKYRDLVKNLTNSIDNRIKGIPENQINPTLENYLETYYKIRFTQCFWSETLKEIDRLTNDNKIKYGQNMTKYEYALIDFKNVAFDILTHIVKNLESEFDFQIDFENKYELESLKKIEFDTIELIENIFDRNKLSPDNTIKDLNDEYLKFIDFEHKAKLKKDFIRNISEYNIKKLTNKHTKTILSHGLTYPTLIYITNTFMLKSIEFISEELNKIELYNKEHNLSKISYIEKNKSEINYQAFQIDLISLGKLYNILIKYEWIEITRTDFKLIFNGKPKSKEINLNWKGTKAALKSLMSLLKILYFQSQSYESVYQFINKFSSKEISNSNKGKHLSVNDKKIIEIIENTLKSK